MRQKHRCPRKLKKAAQRGWMTGTQRGQYVNKLEWTKYNKYCSFWRVYDGMILYSMSPFELVHRFGMYVYDEAYVFYELLPKMQKRYKLDLTYIDNDIHENKTNS